MSFDYNNNNNNLLYKFRLHKWLAPQIATKLVEAGQDEHENIMEKRALITPWSMGWVLDVVLGGRNTKLIALRSFTCG